MFDLATVMDTVLMTFQPVVSCFLQPIRLYFSESYVTNYIYCSRYYQTRLVTFTTCDVPHQHDRQLTLKSANLNDSVCY